jgi:hypothetical protein
MIRIKLFLHKLRYIYKFIKMLMILTFLAPVPFSLQKQSDPFFFFSEEESHYVAQAGLEHKSSWLDLLIWGNAGILSVYLILIITADRFKCNIDLLSIIFVSSLIDFILKMHKNWFLSRRLRVKVGNVT